MKKLISIILIAFAFAGIAIAQTPALDQIYEVPWLVGNRRTTTLIADKYMDGLEDTSATVTIPRGTKSFDAWLVADTGITGAVIGDDDSCHIIGYLLYPGATTANWVLATDTLIETHSADTAYNTSATNIRPVQLADTCWTEFIYPPSDSAAVPRPVGADNLWARKYHAMQFVVRVTDSTSMDGSKLYIRFNSESWRQEDAKSGH